MQAENALSQARRLLLADLETVPEGRRDRHARLLAMVDPGEGVAALQTRGRDDVAALREVFAAAARWQPLWCASRGVALWREGPQDPWMRVFLGSPLVFGMLNAQQSAPALALFQELAALEASDRTNAPQRDATLAELIALASRLRLGAQADSYVARLISGGRRSLDGAVGQLAAQGDYARAERLLDSTVGRADLLVTLIERLAPTSPTRAGELLARLEKATPRAENSRAWCQAARAVVAHASPSVAFSLSQRVKNQAHRTGALALAATRQPDRKLRESLFTQALTATDRRAPMLRARICAVAFESSPALGKALAKKAAPFEGPESAFWLARIDPVQARKLLGATWSREGASDSERAECATAMAPLDPARSLQMLGEISNLRERRSALLALCRYLFLTPAERKIVAFSDLFDGGDPLPTPIRGW